MKKQKQIRVLLESGKTNIVGGLAAPVDIFLAQSDPDAADIYEWRVDCVLDDWTMDVISLLKKPIIVTVRDEKEGGKQPWMLNTRAGHYRQYAKFATFFDIEAANVVEMSDVILSSRRRFDTGLIVSCHFLKDMPTFSAIERGLRICQEAGGDIFKVAVNPKNYDEFIKFSGHIAKLQRRSSTPIAAMCVDKFGPVSRVLSVMNRSPLVYGSMDKPVIVGQLKVSGMPLLFKQLNAV